MLKNKTILLGVTGGIAAYKSAILVSKLCKMGATVHVIMTENATKFIAPLTFESLSKNKCVIDTFDRTFTFDVEHISLAKKADMLVIAPATANIIGKLANGIADDMLTTTTLACTCPKLVVPAMNTNMYQNPIVTRNMETLKEYGFKIEDPASGLLACGDTGIGKMPEPEDIIKYIEFELAHTKDMLGENILVTAGATRESLDPVRFLTNHSTGKMGYSIAAHCANRGANVTLISANSNLEVPPFVDLVKVSSTKEMFDEVTSRSLNQNIIIKAAAVSDYRPKNISDEKIKKNDEDMSIPLERTEDILSYLGSHKQKKQFLCGFSMETENMIINSKKKLEKKNLDMIVANNLKVEGAGFGVDTNVITIITKDEVHEYDIMEKYAVAEKIIDAIQNMRNSTIAIHKL